MILLRGSQPPCLLTRRKVDSRYDFISMPELWTEVLVESLRCRPFLEGAECALPATASLLGSRSRAYLPCWRTSASDPQPAPTFRFKGTHSTGGARSSPLLITPLSDSSTASPLSPPLPTPSPSQRAQKPRQQVSAAATR